MLGGDEYRLFQEIASNSMNHSKPPLLPNGKAGSSSTHTKAPPASASASPAPATRAAAIRAIPPISLPLDSSGLAPAAGNPDADTPPPPCYVPSTPRGDEGRRGRNADLGSSSSSSSRARRRPILAHSNSAPFPETSDSSFGSSSVWSRGGGAGKQGDGQLSGGRPASVNKNKSIWDQPENPTRQQRGPKYYTARRSRPPAGPLTGSGSFGGTVVNSGKGTPVDPLSPDEVGKEGNDVASCETKPVNGGAEGSGGDAKKKTREIKKRMWGKRPSWTGALIEPAAGAATAGAAAASVPGASTREAAGASAAPRTESGLNHLIVLVHGLGGRPADMAFMRSYLQTLMPGAEVRTFVCQPRL